MKFLFFSLLIFTTSCAPKIHSNQSALFKDSMAPKIEEYQSFDISKVSFLISPPKTSLDPKFIDLISKKFPVVLSKNNPKHIELLLEDWILDGVFFTSPPKNINDSLLTALSKAQLFSLFNPQALEYIKKDPFSRSEKYFEIWSKNYLQSEKKEHTYTPLITLSKKVDSNSSLWEQIDSLIKNHPETKLISPEYFSFLNQKIIVDDLTTLLLYGALFFLLILIAFMYYRLHKILYFLPIIALAVYGSAILISFLFDGIHGLTLSFGSSIVGLSLDYAVHSSFHQEKFSIWKKNILALLTTLTFFVVISFSTVPLFREIAFFSIFGLLISFTLMLLFDLKFRIFQSPLPINTPLLKISKWTLPVVILMTSSFLFFATPLSCQQCSPKDSINKVHSKESFFSGVGINHNSSLKALMYVPPHLKNTLLNLEKTSSSRLVKITPLQESVPPDTFGLESFINYDLKLITKRASEWENSLLKYKKNLTQSFFDPYINSIKTQLHSGFNPESRNYLSLFISKNKKISFVTPQNSEAKAYFKNIGFWSPSEYIDLMGSSIFKEILYALSFSLLLTVLISFFLTFNIWKSLGIVFPFTTAVALFSCTTLITRTELNLIHLIGLLMLLGVSIDYGVFGVTTNQNRNSTLSAFIFTTLTTLAGFGPLMMAHHPVLSSLGYTLTLGILGIFVGGCLLLFINFNTNPRK